MKISEFRIQIAYFCKILEAGNANSVAREINRLVAIFDGHETMMLAKFVKLATPPQDIQNHSDEMLLSDILKPFIELEKFLTPCSKQAFLKDLRLFINLLDSAKNASVADFITIAKARLAAVPTVTTRKPVVTNAAIVDEYVARLKASYREVEAFNAVYEELKNNKAVRKQEAAAISDKFAYRTPLSTTKKTSLERILSVHEYYYSNVQKEKAMDGRSAA